MRNRKEQTLKIVTWVLIGVLSLLFFASSYAKIAGFPEINERFATWGLSDMQTLIGFVMLISTVLFLIPATFSLGVLLLSSFFGGTIATHMQHGESYTGPARLLILVWIAYYLRNPSMFKKFLNFIKIQR